MARDKKTTRKEAFSRNLKVGFHDRGMGRGDYGIINDEGHLIAKLQAAHYADQDIPPKIPPVWLPVAENAFLFAAAPDLYDACIEALPALNKAGAKEIAAKIEAAVKKTLPPER